MSRRLQEYLLGAVVVAVGIAAVYGLGLLVEVPIFGGIISVLTDLMAIIAIVILGGLVAEAITNRREMRDIAGMNDERWLYRQGLDFAGGGFTSRPASLLPLSS